MKRHALFCLLTTVLAAQALAPEVELSAEPHHHLTLRKQIVRVYNIEVPPHTDTFMHWHRHDYIYVTLGPTEVVNEVKEKPPVTIHLEDGETHFSPAPFAHIARNQTGQPFRNVTIEIVDDENLRHATTKWDPNKNEDRTAASLSDNAAAERNFKEVGFRRQPRDLAAVAKSALASLYGQTNRTKEAVALYQELINKPTDVGQQGNGAVAAGRALPELQPAARCQADLRADQEENAGNEAGQLATQKLSELK